MMTSSRPLRVAVVGAGQCNEETAAQAQAVGRAIAEAGAWLVCGGGGGVMEAASRGAREAGGRTIGILPGEDISNANLWIEVAIATGLGEARNLLVVCNADTVIAVGGEWGTLSEIALARKIDRPVVLLGSWSLTDPQGHPAELCSVDSPEEAVRQALTSTRLGEQVEPGS